MEFNKNTQLAIESICHSCLRRVITLSQSYQNIYLNENGNIYNRDFPPQTETGCAICFGFLNKYTTEAFFYEIKNAILENEYHYKDFQISVSMPNISILREDYIRKQLLDDKSIKNMVNERYLDIKEEWKRLCLPKLEKVLEKQYNQKSHFSIQLQFTIDDNSIDFEKEKGLLKTILKNDVCNSDKNKTENTFTKQIIQQLNSQFDIIQYKKFYDLPLARSFCNCDIQFITEPIYFAGRYRKFSRTLPQTPWIVDGVRKTPSSIEELLGDYLTKKIMCNSVTLIASGREDVDVRCLGIGRPFILEIGKPKRDNFLQSDLNILQQEINLSTNEIEIKDFQMIDREQTKHIKEGENGKTKCYMALCYSSEKLSQEDIQKIDSIKNVSISQKTPIRVLHRRTLMIRERTISELQATLLDDHHFRINLTTQAGTYVKEFIHGDLGRTRPSVSDILGKNCDILELDVMAVNLEFPPQINL